MDKVFGRKSDSVCDRTLSVRPWRLRVTYLDEVYGNSLVKSPENAFLCVNFSHQIQNVYTPVVCLGKVLRHLSSLLEDVERVCHFKSENL